MAGLTVNVYAFTFADATTQHVILPVTEDLEAQAQQAFAQALIWQESHGACHAWDLRTGTIAFNRGERT